jgi:hypothetical protein
MAYKFLFKPFVTIPGAPIYHHHQFERCDEFRGQVS